MRCGEPTTAILPEQLDMGSSECDNNQGASKDLGGGKRRENSEERKRGLDETRQEQHETTGRGVCPTVNINKQVMMTLHQERTSCWGTNARKPTEI